MTQYAVENMRVVLLQVGTEPRIPLDTSLRFSG